MVVHVLIMVVERRRLVDAYLRRHGEQKRVVAPREVGPDRPRRGGVASEYVPTVVFDDNDRGPLVYDPT